jgi:hypothetical protein
MSLALASFGSYVHYDENSGSNGNSDWIPLLCVLIFTIAFSLGSYFSFISSHPARANEFSAMIFFQEFLQSRGC